MLKRVLLVILILLFAAAIFRFFGEARKSRSASPTIGLTSGKLKPCPDRPNCVSSDAPAGEQQIAPFTPADDETWARLEAAIRSDPNATVVERSDDYLHATYDSNLFGFVDDLELHRRSGEIAVRSASRVGYSDLGVNRKRVEALRAALDS